MDAPDQFAIYEEQYKGYNLKYVWQTKSAIKTGLKEHVVHLKLDSF